MSEKLKKAGCNLMGCGCSLMLFALFLPLAFLIFAAIAGNKR